MTRHPDDEAYRDALREGRELLAEKEGWRRRITVKDDGLVETRLTFDPLTPPSLFADFRDYLVPAPEGWGTRWAPELRFEEALTTSVIAEDWGRVEQLMRWKIGFDLTPRTLDQSCDNCGVTGDLIENDGSVFCPTCLHLLTGHLEEDSQPPLPGAALVPPDWMEDDMTEIYIKADRRMTPAEINLDRAERFPGEVARLAKSLDITPQVFMSLLNQGEIYACPHEPYGCILPAGHFGLCERRQEPDALAEEYAFRSRFAKLEEE
jgi:hypothetical protein